MIKMIPIYIIVFLSVVLTLMCVPAAPYQLRFQQLTGQELQQGYETYEFGSFLTCAYFCAKRVRCRAFHYEIKTQLCHISSLLPLLSKNNTSTFMKVPLLLMASNKMTLKLYKASTSGLQSTDMRYTSVPDCIARMSYLTTYDQQAGSVGFHYEPKTAACNILGFITTYPCATPLERGYGSEIVYLAVANIGRDISGQLMAASSTYHTDKCNESCYSANNANDGIYDDPLLIVKTLEEQVPFWEVRFGDECIIYGVYLYSGDPDNGTAVMMNPSVLTEGGDGWSTCYSVDGIVPMDGTYLFACPTPVTATAMALELSRAEVYGATYTALYYLSFHEIEIYGACFSSYSTSTLPFR